MTHRTRVRANVTAWSSGALAPAELDKFDDANLSCLDADRGGVWAPLSVIEIGGAGFLLSGPVDITGALDVTGIADFLETHFHSDVDFEPNTLVTVRGDARFGTDSGDTITFDGVIIANEAATFGSPTSFSDTVSFEGHVTVDAGASFLHAVSFSDPVSFTDSVSFADDVDFEPGTLVTIRGDARFGTDAGDDITFDGTVTANQHLTCQDSISLNGTANFHANVNLGDNASDAIILGSYLRFTADGRVPERVISHVGVSGSFSARDANVVYAQNVSTPRAYVLLDDNSVDGDRVTFITIATDNDVSVAAPGWGTIALRASSNGSASWVTFYKSGSLWLRTYFIP